MNSSLDDEILIDLLRHFENDTHTLHKECTVLDLPPYTTALSRVKKESDWEALATELKQLDTDWRERLIYLMKLDIQRLKEMIHGNAQC